MKNPFKFGTVVEDEFFTDRIEELQQVKQTLNSDNHRSLGDGFFTRFGNIRFNNGQVGSGSEGEDEFALISLPEFYWKSKVIFYFCRIKQTSSAWEILLKQGKLKMR